jgi:hypothetical protein
MCDLYVEPSLVDLAATLGLEAHVFVQARVPACFRSLYTVLFGVRRGVVVFETLVLTLYLTLFVGYRSGNSAIREGITPTGWFVLAGFGLAILFGYTYLLRRALKEESRQSNLLATRLQALQERDQGDQGDQEEHGPFIRPAIPPPPRKKKPKKARVKRTNSPEKRTAFQRISDDDDPWDVE